MSAVTLQQLITYLCPDSITDDKTLRCLQKYKTESISDIYENMDSAYRYGILQKNKNNNISLYSSIMHCIDPSFKNLDDTEQTQYISDFVNKAMVDIDKEKLFQLYGYRSAKIVKKTLLYDLQQHNNTQSVIRFMSDYFSINIFILNLVTKEIFCMFGDEIYNKYKTNIIICQIGQNFEPVSTKDNTYYNYEDEIIQQLFVHNIKTYYEQSFDHISEYSEDTNSEQKDEQSEPEDMQSESEQKDEQHEPEPEEIVKPSISMKMKLNDLQTIALQYGILLEKNVNGKNKNKTKKELYEEINSKN